MEVSAGDGLEIPNHALPLEEIERCSILGPFGSFWGS